MFSHDHPGSHTVIFGGSITCGCDPGCLLFCVELVNFWAETTGSYWPNICCNAACNWLIFCGQPEDKILKAGLKKGMESVMDLIIVKKSNKKSAKRKQLWRDEYQHQYK